MSCIVSHLIRIARIGFGCFLGCVLLTLGVRAQEHLHPTDASIVALQPLAQQVRRLETALAYLGQPLPARRTARRSTRDGARRFAAAVSEIQRILDRYVLRDVHINPESRVKVEQGAGKAGAGPRRHAPVSRESAQRGRRHGTPRRAEPQRWPCVRPGRRRNVPSRRRDH